MGKFSQSKGYRGEAEIVRALKAMGATLAYRCKSKQGGDDGGAPDVLVPAGVDDLSSWLYDKYRQAGGALPSDIAIEVKNKDTLPPKGVRKALEQARSAAENSPTHALPVLAMKIKGGGWGIYFETKDLAR